MNRLLPIALMWVVVSCATGVGEQPSPSPTSQLPTSQLPTSQLPTSQLPTSQLPTSGGTPPAEGDMTLTGQLNSDTIEGGCTYLQTADGTKYELVYPRGWESPVPMAMGATMTVRGEIATDMASICMIGPIFRVTEVVSVE